MLFRNDVHADTNIYQPTNQNQNRNIEWFRKSHLRAKLSRTGSCTKGMNRRFENTMLNVQGGLGQKQGVPSTIKSAFENFF